MATGKDQLAANLTSNLLTELCAALNLVSGVIEATKYLMASHAANSSSVLNAFISTTSPGKSLQEQSQRMRTPHQIQ